MTPRHESDADASQPIIAPFVDRRAQSDTLTAWVIGAVLAAFMGALGFLAIKDRESFDTRLLESAVNRRAIEARVAATEAQIAAMREGQTYIAATLQRIEGKVDRLERGR